MKGQESLGARLEARKPLPREVWLIAAFVVIVGVTIATVLVPAILNEHPDDDDAHPTTHQHH